MNYRLYLAIPGEGYERIMCGSLKTLIRTMDGLILRNKIHGKYLVIRHNEEFDYDEPIYLGYNDNAEYISFKQDLFKEERQRVRKLFK